MTHQIQYVDKRFIKMKIETLFPLTRSVLLMFLKQVLGIWSIFDYSGEELPWRCKKIIQKKDRWFLNDKLLI